MDKKYFGETKDGVIIYEYELKNDKLKISVINYGGIITGIYFPDKEGKVENVVLNYKTLEEYQNDSMYYGCIAGRHAGRIKDGTLEINGKKYQLEKNNGSNNLHGGKNGFNRKVWEVVEFSNNEITMKYFSKDLEEGYPGNVEIKAIYTLIDDTLKISYRGESDKDTVINLTNHSYFNLSGDLNENILEHKLKIKSKFIGGLDESGAVGHEVLSVFGTPFDFNNLKNIGSEIEEENEQLIMGQGYDHPYILEKYQGEPQIILKHEKSTRVMEIITKEPVVILYTGNYLKSNYRCGVCLETQNMPDYLRHPKFEKKIYNKERLYQSETSYRFYSESTENKKGGL